MGLLRVAFPAMAMAACVGAATIGTVFNLTGGAADLVLDEPRGRLYLVRPSPYNQIDVYSIPQRRVLTSIPTDAFPLAAALSPDGNTLYVTCHDGSALNAIDVNAMAVSARVSLPAKPEGVAVGNDGRVLISTIGTGANNLLNTLLIYDPNSTDVVLQTVPVTAPPPMPPLLPPPAGRSFLSSRSQLITSHDGTRIIGVNRFNNTTAVVFVYEVASGTVLRSRLVGDTSTVLSVAPDGTRFMMGLRLYETDTLTVLAQQNAANAPFPLNANTAAQGFNLVAQQFNTQQNQGGSVFAPDGGTIYSAFNIAPVQNPPTRPNVSELLHNDPDNLLIRTALQLPENLSGKMVISSDGGTLHALSESGIMTVPLGQVMLNPVAVPESPVVLLANDMCGVTAGERRVSINVRNEGRGQMPPLPPTLVQSTPIAIAGPPGLGGIGGPGGGAPGGPVIIVLPPAPGAGLPGQLPVGMNPQQQQLQSSAPTVRASGSPQGTMYEFTFNAANARSLGTVTPHDYLVTAPTAVNIPRTVRVFQNQRDPEARAQLVPAEVGISSNEGLTDIVADSVRQVAYIANSGMNRVEVFDMQSRSFGAPIKVGQLPRAMALSPDGATLYVANTGGESISVIDLDKREVVGRIKFPPIPFNGNVGVITPSVIAASQRGLQIVMSNGTLWRVVGEDAVPRPVSAQIGTATIPAPRTMASTPNGEFILLLDGNGNAYLYDSLVDDFVARRQVATPPITGYYGPVTAGPRGQYYVVNGLVLNQSLSPISGAGMVPGVAMRPVAAVTAASGTSYARFSQPVRANANAVVADNPAVEIVDANTGAMMRSIPVVEGPLSAVVGNQRANVVGRTMAVDGNTAYVLTTSGLTVVNLDPPAAADRPVINQNGIVSLASMMPSLAQGGLISIFGRNLGVPGSADGTQAPAILGDTCVTLGSIALPLTMTSADQVNAYIPANLATGRYALTVRAVDRRLASVAQQVTIAKYAPAVFTDKDTGYAAVYHADDGRPVTPEDRAKRDERLVLYATGLGPARAAAPGTPVNTDPVKAFFGDNRYSTAEMIVESSTLIPSMLGVYELRLYVPWHRMRGESLPVTIRIGNVTSPVNGPIVPVVAVD